VTAAVPVAAPRGLERVRAEADAVVCPHVVEQLAVVGQAYHLFEPLDEWYVAGLLEQA
jgi:predicted phosphoribosyltransferase